MIEHISRICWTIRLALDWKEVSRLRRGMGHACLVKDVDVDYANGQIRVQQIVLRTSVRVFRHCQRCLEQAQVLPLSVRQT